ncbi:hypothetical protein ACIA5C_07660 [Actinoplanes sp. NPDC051343]|uniref:hypothetical protein n=1 Tax=Actinoplanes sp. NPDC051343 TaxID=3363906 RepID=UPI0037ABED7B
MIRLWQSGHREVKMQLNVVILVVGLFVALGIGGGLAGHRLGVAAGAPAEKGPAGGSAPPVTTPASTPAPAPTGTSACDHHVGEPGVVDVQIVSAPKDLTICPVLLNNGAPITGPFAVNGRFVGRPDLHERIAVVNRADPDTCDASGRPPVMGLFQARTFVIHGDGTWSFTDGLGYDEAVTYARNYAIVDASPAALAVIRNDWDDWNRKHPGSNDYAGMTALPAGAKVLATFRQPPGKYEGKGSPCKNT